MKNQITWILMGTLCALVSACSDHGPSLDPETAALVTALEEEEEPLPADPLQWTDEELGFLDDLSNQAVIGLGEATHGTSEFFKAKHRIFRYMAEHHGFRIFAIEADFGESMFINEAVLNSDKSQIETLMKEKMHFWTWRNAEVRDLLYWMCDFNVGKPENEKVQYWGIDCQFNTFHTDMLVDYLTEVQAPFLQFAEEILAEAKSASASRFSGYTEESFVEYFEKVESLTDSLVKYEEAFITSSSPQEFELNKQLSVEIAEVCSVARDSGGSSLRDEYMARNTKWLYDYFGSAKIVLWAHNFHISDYSGAGTMGSFLKDEFPGKYQTTGFLFSRGNFLAKTMTEGKVLDLHVQSINDNPRPGSLNDIFSKSTEKVFTVELSDLQKHSTWPAAFIHGIQYFQIGSVYNNRPSDYYGTFNAVYFDRLIYFDETSAALYLTN